MTRLFVSVIFDCVLLRRQQNVCFVAFLVNNFCTPLCNYYVKVDIIGVRDEIKLYVHLWMYKKHMFQAKECLYDLDLLKNSLNWEMFDYLFAGKLTFQT